MITKITNIIANIFKTNDTQYEMMLDEDEVTPQGACKICGSPVGADKKTHKTVHYDVHDWSNALYATKEDHEALL